MEFGNQSKSYLSILSKLAQNSFKACGFEQILVDGTIQNLTIPTDARYAVMVLESDLTAIAARYLEFGGTNTQVTATTIGLPLKDGAVIDITDRANLEGFQITEEAVGNTVLNVQYYK